VFARDEWFKQPAGNIAGNSRSNIGDGDLDHAVIKSPRRQGDLPRFLIGHRLKRIADQVDDHLLDLNAVHQYNPGAVIEFKRQTDLLRSDPLNTRAPASSINEASASVRFSVSLMLTNWRRLRTISLARNACPTASSVTSCAVRELAGPPARKQPLGRRKRLAYLVRKGGSHLTGGRDAGCPRQFILQFLKAQIGLRAFKPLRDESCVAVLATPNWLSSHGDGTFAKIGYAERRNLKVSM
jgi:hypothetical protein